MLPCCDDCSRQGNSFGIFLPCDHGSCTCVSPQVHHNKKAEAIKDLVSQGIPEKSTDVVRNEYLGTSWCIATMLAGYPTTNIHQEGIHSAVKRIWTRHERGHFLFSVKWVKRMLTHTHTHTQTQMKAPSHPKKIYSQGH